MESKAAEAAGGKRVGSDAVSLWSRLHAAGRIGECEQFATRLTDACPGDGKAWQLLGMSLLARGSASGALRHIEHAAGLSPGDYSIWDNLGVVLQQLGRSAGARDAFRRSIALAPSAAGTWANASNNELQAGNLDEALRLASRAVELSPRLPAACLNLGNVLARLGRREQAESVLRQAIAIEPRFSPAWLSLSQVLADQERLSDACSAARQALELRPDYADAHVNLGSFYNRLGDIRAAAAHYRRAREINPSMVAAWSGELYCLSHDERLSAEELFAAHRAFGEHVEKLVGAPANSHSNNRNPERRLRVGVLSGDLCDHPVARFLEPVWRVLDRSALDLVVYDNRPVLDEVSMRLRAMVRQWVDVSALTDMALDARIRSDEIDILIDHSGHTAFNRLGVVARKPAPVQVMWFGYPGTSGLKAMDYRLVDSTIAPPGRLDHLFTERLAYLPVMQVFEKPSCLPDIGAAPIERNGYITYGSFNRANKLGDAVVDCWARILARNPAARLLIGAVPEPAVADELRRRFGARGIDAGRLEFRPRLAMRDYLAAHNEVDVLLDTFPWSSGTTGNLALWMGVPTITYAGDSLVRRLGAARMVSAGLDDFVAETPERYVEIAVDMADRRADLQRLRSELRHRLEDNGRHQPSVLARALERRLREMWHRWCRGAPAETLR